MTSRPARRDGGGPWWLVVAASAALTVAGLAWAVAVVAALVGAVRS